jgi:CRISPR RNA silencing complex Cmr2 subunit-like protein
VSTEKRCLTLLGTASIQDYLFRSNRLKENLGASHLIATALKQWESKGARPLFVGGGNAAVILDRADAAKEAVFAWSREWLEKAPGLRLVAAHEDFEVGGLREAFQKAQRQLFENENRPAHGAPLGALPVVRSCPSTGLAAEFSDGGNWLSGEAHRKQEEADAANIAFQERYAGALNVEGNDLNFPLDFENLGQELGASQIAVVHADGNGIGQVLRGVTENCQTDDDFERKLSGASAAITKLAQNAFRGMLQDLSAALPDLEKAGVHIKGEYYPVRPLVDGGDDLTFVSQGKLGLALAVRYLRCFETESKKHKEALGVDGLTACAGVVLVGQRFPFARAYGLAEELAASAKRRRKEKNGGGSWLDFEIVKEGWSGSLRATREQYRHVDGERNLDLLCRPYRIGVAREGWEAFESIWRDFHNSDSWPRSHAKRLLETLARGSEETGALLREFGSRGRSLPSAGGNAWQKEQVSGTEWVWRTPYFDPLDMLDYHVEWPQPTGKEEPNVATED